VSAARAPEPARILFVYFGPFTVNSAIQAFHFGNELTELGWDVTLAGVGDPTTIRKVGAASFETMTLHDLAGLSERWRRDPQPGIVFAWTPRENVRRATESVVRPLGLPYVVHLEDNEEYLLSTKVGMTMAEMRRLTMAEQDRLVPADKRSIHPTHSQEFTSGADGITVITEELNEFNRAGLPHHVARPGIDADRFRPDLEPARTREALGIAPDEFVIVYHGTVHFANQHEMLSLYLAIKLLRRQGRPVRLVRLGETELGGVDPLAFGAMRDGVVELGAVEWRQIPAYLALADAYVQPGATNDFNRYRLPSKLPEFLAMGRPVVLPNCNIGHDLTDGENALLMNDGNALEIVAKVEALLDDRELRERLAAGARRFALEELSWEDNSVSLARFLRRLIDERAAAGSASPVRSAA
jgi:glycosyltransferase involved in cell wall biosynthesis